MERAGRNGGREEEIRVPSLSKGRPEKKNSMKGGVGSIGEGEREVWKESPIKAQVVHSFQKRRILPTGTLQKERGGGSGHSLTRRMEVTKTVKERTNLGVYGEQGGRIKWEGELPKSHRSSKFLLNLSREITKKSTPR